MTDPAKLTLVSHKLCPYVQRAVISLTEKNVPFERIDVDLSNKPAGSRQSRRSARRRCYWSAILPSSNPP